MQMERLRPIRPDVGPEPGRDKTGYVMPKGCITVLTGLRIEYTLRAPVKKDLDLRRALRRPRPRKAAKKRGERVPTPWPPF